MEHILAVLQVDQQANVEHMDIDTFVNAGQSFAMLDGDEVIGCAGVQDLDVGRGMSWSLIPDNLKGMRYFQFHKAVQNFLDTCDYRRVEMAVSEYHRAGHRWALMLGFRHEGYMRQYFPNGDNAALYARVK